MKNELISIIVPVYKVEKYLDKCLESIVKQTYKELEIILVDDGSPDNCPKMCDNWANRDKRIKVIHKENGGLSDARNKGIDIATGKYISFIDSDDYVEPQMFEILIKEANKNNPDIVMCGYKKIGEFEEYFFKNYNTNKINSVVYKKEQVFDLLFNKKIPMITSAWAKLYKKNIFDSLRYPEGKIHEDEYIIPFILNETKVFSFVNLPLYLYLQRESSIVGSNFSQKRLDILEAKKGVCDFCEKNKQNYVSQAYYSLIKTNILYYYYSKWGKLSKQIYVKLRRDTLEIGKKYKVKTLLFLMFKYMPHILEIIIKIMK